MDVKTLQKQFENCKCNRPHLCPIDSVVIGKNVLNKLLPLTENFNDILLVADNNTCKFSVAVLDILKSKIQNHLILQPEKNVVIPNENTIEKIQSCVNEKTDLIIGVGSGVINDLCKFVSFNNDLPYYIVATAPSMDGYASVGSALILKGMKDTKNALPPKAIIADTEILASCPIEMIKAGYGDVIGKFSCLNDWKLSALINNEYFCEEIYNLTFSCVLKVKDLAKKLLMRDEESIAVLMEALVLVGVLMSFVGNSRPASGSEHHLSHFFEITGIIDKTEYFPHGIDVLYSSIYTQIIREELLRLDDIDNFYKPEKSEYKNKINAVYKSVAPEIIALQEKMGRYESENLKNYQEKWGKIKEILKEAPSVEEMKGYLNDIELSLDDFTSLYGEEKINDALYFAKDLKDRYTVLWPYYFLTYKG